MKEVFKNSPLILGSVVGFTVIVVFAIMWAAGIGIFSANTNAVVAKKTLAPRIETTINQPENAIANYERFHNECRDILAKNEQIANLKSRYDSAKKAAQGDDPFGNKAQAEQDALNDLIGLKNLRAAEAQTYNSQSAQYTREQFKDANLPERINAPYNVDCG